jgi:hypothetical protein
MTLIILISALKALLFSLVIKIFIKLNIAQPFSNEISKLINKMSETAIALAIISYFGQQYANSLIQKGFDLNTAESYWVDAFTFFLIAAMLYVIAQIFNKGIKIQAENDLTI